MSSITDRLQKWRGHKESGEVALPKASRICSTLPAGNSVDSNLRSEAGYTTKHLQTCRTNACERRALCETQDCGIGGIKVLECLEHLNVSDPGTYQPLRRPKVALEDLAQRRFNELFGTNEDDTYKPLRRPKTATVQARDSKVVADNREADRSLGILELSPSTSKDNTPRSSTTLLQPKKPFEGRATNTPMQKLPGEAPSKPVGCGDRSKHAADKHIRQSKCWRNPSPRPHSTQLGKNSGKTHEQANAPTLQAKQEAPKKPPTVAKKAKSLPGGSKEPPIDLSNCICDRAPQALVCMECRKYIYGRVSAKCPAHQNVTFLMDLSMCPYCMSPKELLRSILNNVTGLH